MSDLTQARIDAARERARNRLLLPDFIGPLGTPKAKSYRQMTAALDRLIALERAEAADIWTEHLEDHDSGMCGKCWSEAELLAAIEDIEGDG